MPPKQSEEQRLKFHLEEVRKIKESLAKKSIKERDMNDKKTGQIARSIGIQDAILKLTKEEKAAMKRDHLSASKVFLILSKK
jgi:hypothetical protein